MMEQSSSLSRASVNFQIGKSVVESLEFIINNELWCDVTIRVGKADKTIIIKAHKFILKARSPVFEAMLSGNFSESVTKEIAMPEEDPTIIKSLIRYLYTDKVEINVLNVMSLRNLSKMYMLDGLKALADHYVENDLSKKLSGPYVAHALTAAIKLCQDDVIDKCLEYCKTDYLWPTTFMDSDLAHELPLVKVSHEALLKIAQCDAMDGQMEGAFIKLCLKWAELQPGKSLRNTLGNIIHQIRYHELQTAEFTSIFKPNSAVLSKREKLAILYIISNGSEQSVADMVALGFNMCPRIAELGRYSSKYRQDLPESEVQYHGKEVIRLTPQFPVLFHGFTFGFGSIDEHVSSFEVTNDRDDQTQAVLASGDIYVVDSPDLNHWFPEPIRLEPNKNYTLTCRVPDSTCLFYGKSHFQKNEKNVNYIDISIVEDPVTLIESVGGHIIKMRDLSYVSSLYIQPLEIHHEEDHDEDG